MQYTDAENQRFMPKLQFQSCLQLKATESKLLKTEGRSAELRCIRARET